MRIPGVRQLREPGALRALDALPAPALVVAADRRVLYRNAASRAAGALDCLAIACGRVCNFEGTASDRLDAIVSKAAAGEACEVLVTLWTDPRPTLWRLRAVPLASAGAGASGASDEDYGSDDSTGAVLLLVDPPAAARRLLTLIEHLFRLTAAEARVLALLIDARAPAEIARQLDVSVATVRTHLKALFAKTRTRRQSELVALVWSAA